MAGKVKKESHGYNYNYANMGQIHDYLEENKLSYWQYIETDALGVDYVMTVPIVDGKELQPRKGSRVLNDGSLKGGNKAQDYGSALTYARRYSLMMVFGLAPVDDDGFACREVKPTAKDLNEIEAMANELGIDYGAILNEYGCRRPVELNGEQVKDIKKKLKATKGGNNE